MKAIILAAGRGSRMGSLTAAAPKCLVKLKGRSLLDYQLSAMYAANIQDVAVVCGYQRDKIDDERILKKFVNHQWEQTNMVRSLLCASEWLEKEDCIISYADIFYQSSAIQALGETSDQIALTYDLHFKKLWSARFANPLSDLETFQVDARQNLIEIGRRAQTFEEVHGQYMGLIKLTPQGWHEIRSLLKNFSELELNKLDMTSLLRHVIDSGIPIKAVPYSDIWGEVDQASDLELYENWN